MKKFYIGYHNKPWDMKDFTVMFETERESAALGVKSLYNKSYEENHMDCELVIYESRNLPENAHY